MKNILKLTGVSILAIMAASNANAAGYTCEELIEYTSCNDGFYLNSGDCLENTSCPAGNYLLGTCPEGYAYGNDWCLEGPEWYGSDRESCGDIWYGPGCVDEESWEIGNGKASDFVAATYKCTPCVAGSYQNVAGQYECTVCVAGTYQPESGKTSCIDAPAGNYVAGTGATNYTACATGSYQPSAGQSSCITCPAGSECPTTIAATACEVGEYAPAGSTACSTCPTHAYTNASGQRVTVPATSDAGAGSATACYIDPDTYFTDAAGTYHFKENCVYSKGFVDSEATEEQLIARCRELGGSWEELIDDNRLLGGAKSYSGFYCAGGIDRFDVTEAECNSLGDWVWIVDEGEEMCECSLSTVAIDLNTGNEMCVDTKYEY